MTTSDVPRERKTPISDDQFEAMKRRFQDVGDNLNDLQLLELADCYHDILRWRRSLRCRLPGRPRHAHASEMEATDKAGPLPEDAGATGTPPDGQ